MNAPDNVVFANDFDDCGLMVEVSRFASTVSDPVTETIPWTNVVDEALLPTIYPSKRSQPLIKLGAFGGKRTPNGSLRSNENLETISGVEIDHDAGTMTLAEARARLEVAGVKAVLYTSASHAVEKPRWRILAPCSEQRPASERERLVARINGVLAGAAAGESFTLSQIFYIGRVEGVPYEVAVTFDEAEAGACIDELVGLDAGAIGKQGSSRKPKTPHRAGGTIEQRVRELGRPLREGDGRRALMLKIAGERARRGASVELIVMELEVAAGLHFDPADPVDWANIEQAIRDIVANDERELERLEKLADRVRASGDQAEVFGPEVLAGMRKLKEQNRGKYESVRAKLKKTGVRLTALDEAMRGEREARDERSQVEILASIVEQHVDAFATPGADTYADFGDVRETARTRSRSFRAWLTRKFFEQEGRPAHAEALTNAIALAEAQALAPDAPRRDVFVRVARDGAKVYVDLGCPRWRVIEVDAEGWRVITKPPVRFRRPNGLLELPEPIRGGGVEAIKSILNVKTQADFVLVVAWMTAALAGVSPYALLAIAGEAGTGKTSACEVVRSIIDPSAPLTRGPTREERDLVIAASANFVLAYDNLSQMPEWCADALCRIVTGAGWATRMLTTDADEMIFNESRPIIINSIENLLKRQDLADRALTVELGVIAEHERETKADVMARVANIRPTVLGALLDGVAEGLRRLPSVKLERLPRMADFAKFSVAAETAFGWAEGTFMAAYAGNRAAGLSTIAESDEVAARVLQLVERGPWSGSLTELLTELERQGPVKDHQSWPRDGAAVSARIKRAGPGLRRLGVGIDWRRTKARREITLTPETPKEVT
jgi:hypothetical protein